MKVADQLVSMLVQAGVKRVYGITGDSLNPVNDAIRRSGELQWIHVRHEEVAAYAASMDAELNGIGCCMGSSGPGHVHLINGLYDANHSGNPVIAIASTCPSNKFGQEYFQETNPFYLFNDCSKYLYVANTPKQFPHMLQGAIQAAKELKGVAVIGLPGDVAAAEAENIVTSTKVYSTKPIYRPCDEELNELADLLNSNKKIALYCEHGCRYAVKEVKELAAKLNAPMAFSFRGKIFFDTDDNPYATGLNGLLGYRSGYLTCNEADVLIMLGTDFPYAEFLPNKTKVVQIDINGERLGRRAKVDIGLVGDIKDTIEALLPKLNDNSDTSFLEEMRNAYKKVQKAFDRFVTPDTKTDQIQPEYVASVIDKYADDDAVITVDTGMCSVWAARFIKGKKSRYMTGSFNHGSMANAMPMAIGAAASNQDKQVIAMCGDGGISMLLGDLATIKQYNLPIKMIVFDNRALGMVKLEMEVDGYIDWQTNMVNPEFDKVAQAMGIKGYAVHEGKDVDAVIKQAFETEGPALVTIFTNPNALAMPPHVTIDQVQGYAKSILKKVWQGNFSDIEETISSNLSHIREVL